MDHGPIAFVAMSFYGDPWNDKRYLVISDVLREAGYRPLRADEIPSSGAVMVEVEEHLKGSDKVVVDISGDSHNVSYELGFLHGLGRDPDDVILLCERDKIPPFNYSHFRHHSYNDIRHLRGLLRFRLNISTPLADDQVGYSFSFKGGENEFYGRTIAQSIVSGLKSMRFSGRCEYYAGTTIFSDPNQYVVGLALKHAKRKKKITLSWYDKLAGQMVEDLKERGSKTAFYHDLSELTEVRTLRECLLPRGVAEFRDGQVIRLLNASEEDSWFAEVIREQLLAGEDGE